MIQTIKQKLEKDRFVSHMTIVRVLSKGFNKVRNALDLRYHPERHYMRGPGPACRRKQQMEARLKSETSRETTTASPRRMTPQFAPKA
ncbi:hypothetical protein GCM10011385_10340 [Nitratireductor aestuarii]|uniref:Uncharacterized protein n=1 Tax=Nitratireductor aestuarii TaxID=1735103 RepID=A0A916W1H4_9HYPH|nr:hypothetical protein GCM10011385_10340 [Nitratireductor aestuarii]